MFVIPCKFQQQKPVIFDCVKSIRLYNKETIVIVDSNSDDISYGIQLSKTYNDVIFENTKNINYEIGALKIVFEKYNFSNYFLLHDSMIVHDNLSHIKNYEAISVRYFNSWDGIGGINLFSSHNNVMQYRYGFDNEEQKNIVYNWNKNNKIPYSYNGVFGSSFCAKKEIIQKLNDENLFECLPKNKLESQAMERHLGILFNKINIDHYSHSLMGEHHTNPFNSKYITKIIMGRQ